MKQNEERIAELVNSYFRSVMHLDLDLASVGMAHVIRRVLYPPARARARVG